MNPKQALYQLSHILSPNTHLLRHKGDVEHGLKKSLEVSAGTYIVIL